MCTRMDAWEAGSEASQADATPTPGRAETPFPVHRSLLQPHASGYSRCLIKTSQCHQLWWKLGFLAPVAVMVMTTHRRLLPQTHRGQFLLRPLQSQIEN